MLYWITANNFLSSILHHIKAAAIRAENCPLLSPTHRTLITNSSLSDRQLLALWSPTHFLPSPTHCLPSPTLFLPPPTHLFYIECSMGNSNINFPVLFVFKLITSSNHPLLEISVFSYCWLLRDQEVDREHHKTNLWFGYCNITKYTY